VFSCACGPAAADLDQLYRTVQACEMASAVQPVCPPQGSARSCSNTLRHMSHWVCCRPDSPRGPSTATFCAVLAHTSASRDVVFFLGCKGLQHTYPCKGLNHVPCVRGSLAGAFEALIRNNLATAGLTCRHGIMYASWGCCMHTGQDSSAAQPCRRTAPAGSWRRLRPPAPLLIRIYPRGTVRNEHTKHMAV
jgi:hypothetical protein